MAERQAGSSKELGCGGPLACSLAIVVQQENLLYSTQQHRRSASASPLFAVLA